MIYLVLNTRVLSLSVFTNKDGIDVVVGSLEALDGETRTNVGKEVEGSTKSKVERDVSLSNYSKGRVRSRRAVGVEFRTHLG